MTTFGEMDLPEFLTQKLQEMGFHQPTPIQEQAIPLALEGKDILGSAQTGTGKTGAFGIPLLSHLIQGSRRSALIMTPTRELATQVMDQLRTMLGKKSKIKTALLIGGDPMVKQLVQLRKGPRLVIGTPGRICDHLRRKSFQAEHTDFLVLDETDRMLDMGFTEDIEYILSHLAPKRQTLLFSATLPKNIVNISNQYLQDPVHIRVTTTSKPAENLEQNNVEVKEHHKYDHLVSELEAREGSVIIFMKTKISTEKMAIKLSKEGHSANAIHGNLRQSKRDRVIKAFRQKKHRILVATDVAARGLDIPHIEHVINYDLPQCPEDYIHRIGRTARAGAKGAALNFISPKDRGKWRAIDRILNPDKEQEDVPSMKEHRKKRPRFPRQKKHKTYGRKKTFQKVSA